MGIMFIHYVQILTLVLHMLQFGGWINGRQRIKLKINCTNSLIRQRPWLRLTDPEILSIIFSLLAISMVVRSLSLSLSLVPR